MEEPGWKRVQVANVTVVSSILHCLKLSVQEASLGYSCELACSVSPQTCTEYLLHVSNPGEAKSRQLYYPILPQPPPRYFMCGEGAHEKIIQDSAMMGNPECSRSTKEVNS